MKKAKPILFLGLNWPSHTLNQKSTDDTRPLYLVLSLSPQLFTTVFFICQNYYIIHNSVIDDKELLANYLVFFNSTANVHKQTSISIQIFKEYNTTRYHIPKRPQLDFPTKNSKDTPNRYNFNNRFLSTLSFPIKCALK